VLRIFNLFRIAWNHIRRSPYQAMSAILVLTLTFFVISFVAGILYVSESAIKYFESKPQVTFFLKDTVKKDAVDKLISNFKNDPVISGVKYVSKEDALKLYRKQFEKDPLLLEMVTASILPASIEVSTQDVTNLQTVYETYKNNSSVEEVIFQKDIVQNLSRWTRVVRIVGFGYIGFHLILSFFVIMTIISMKIAIKKEEIEILGLLGATRSYIRTPFILEGMFYGFIGSTISSLLFLILGGIGWMKFSGFLAGMNFLSFDPMIILLYISVMTAFGLLLGWFSSMLAVFRFLK
jgi:cell division transport system permease protein